MGIGPAPLYPESFPGHDITWADQLYGFVADSFKATPRLTVNASLSYVYDPLSAAADRDLARPAVLAPFFENGYTGKPKIDDTMFSPSLGIAWDPKGDGKWVIRAGSGIYWGTGSPGPEQAERPSLLPVGDGQEVIQGNSITNPVTGKGTLLFSKPTTFTLGNLVNAVAAIRANLASTVLTNMNTNFAGETNYDFFKSTSGISDPNNKPAYSSQSTIGAQHQLGNDWLLSANFIWNVTNHTSYTQDANLTNRTGINCPYAVATPTTSCPVLPGYGTTTITYTQGRSNYRGLLVTAKKRLSHRFQASVSYTLSSNKDTQVVNYLNWAQNWGYDPADRKNTLFGDVTANLPWGFKATIVNDMQSSTPFAMTLSGIDLNGDGTTNDQLPGLALNCLNISCSVGDLRNAVATFNSTYAGKKDARGNTIGTINLPANLNTTNRIITQDFRLTKAIKIKERLNLNLIAECFNIFNISNLSFAAANPLLPSAGNLLGTGFGLPTARLGNFNSSEGPRAFQFGARITF